MFIVLARPARTPYRHLLGETRPAPQEDRCYEWLRMLKEDKPAKAALLAAEVGCTGSAVEELC